MEETLLAFDQSVGGPSDTVREGDIIEAHSTLFEAVARGDCEHESPDCEVIVKHRLLAKGDIAPRPDWPRMESHEEVALVGLDLERRCEWSLVARSRSGVAAEKAFNDALATARTEAGKIIAAARADIQKDLDAATAKADVEISTKAAESEKRLAEIRDGALEAVEAVAKDTAKEIVAGLGGTADARTVNAAVAARLKG